MQTFAWITKLYFKANTLSMYIPFKQESLLKVEFLLHRSLEIVILIRSSRYTPLLKKAENSNLRFDVNRFHRVQVVLRMVVIEQKKS